MKGGLLLAPLSDLLGQLLPATQLHVTIIGWTTVATTTAMAILLARGSPPVADTLGVALVGVLMVTVALSSARRDAALPLTDAAQVELWYKQMKDDWGSLTPCAARSDPRRQRSHGLCGGDLQCHHDVVEMLEFAWPSCFDWPSFQNPFSCLPTSAIKQ